MGALNPLFLAAALAVGIPIFLHLFQRHEARRISFPALRYLARTEREHARRIRFRQILLLLLRVAIVLSLVGAGAGLFLRGRGGAHPPTAVAVILDNSMSTGVVSGGVRALDRLKSLAERTIDLANEADRIWIVRAGEPWATSLPGRPAEARRAIGETGPSGARGDLTEALARAAELVRTSGMEHVEVHLLSDLQASAFADTVAAPAGDVPVVVWADDDPPPANRALVRVLVGGGLPPRQGQRSEVSVQAAPGAEGDTVPVPVRVVLDDRVRSAASIPPGATLSLPLPPVPAGWIQGYVDQDADALRADDRRHFAFLARPAPTVAVGGDPGLFVEQAVSVLMDAGRVSEAPASTASVLISAAGDAWEAVDARGAVVLVPPADATQLPALNRRLAEHGVPWRAERRLETGESGLEGDELPEPLRDVRVRLWYRLTPAGDSLGPTAALARIAGDPWLLEGRDSGGRRYLLLASPLDGSATSLPVSADMLRFVDWVAAQWAQAGGAAPERLAGAPLSAPRAADGVRLPSGEVLPLDGTRMVRATGEPGFYTFLAGDSVVRVEAVNPPPGESDLLRLDPDDLDTRVGSDVTVVRREGAWERSVFRQRQGPRLWRPLLLLALALLLGEAMLAAAGRQPAHTRPVGEPRESVRGVS